MSNGLRWRKSTRSDNQGGDCVEVAAATVELWRKASRSENQGGHCVELAEVGCVCEEHGSMVGVRDSKDPDGPMLAFSPSAWRRLSRRIKSGALDLK
ncbi:DUF397 domain-containing protein [Actinomadura latina]|uniref:DUF397 domain-containing protein n=2 Tax=Actinomadura latina TaxID=163603 RepID=A0A846Z852_9ACTN|nr:DUF397 domain-containing protein [Actinomadura latina]NKZ06838.1 DUF397 domain-containing protein [Actinomadura latina]